MTKSLKVDVNRTQRDKNFGYKTKEDIDKEREAKKALLEKFNRRVA